MLKRSACFMIAVFLVISILSGCANTPVSGDTETSAVPSDPVSTSEPVQTATEPSIQPSEPPTEAPTEVPTEAPTEPAEKVLLTDAEIVLTAKGETREIYCGEVPLENVSWFSDDESIALFSQGTVVAINPGTTTVHARFQDQSVSCLVTCDVEPEERMPRISDALLNAPRLAPPVVDMEDTSFFDDAAFIGDSVSYVLQQWHGKNGAFGDAVFLVRSSLGLQNSLDGRMQIFYQGVGYSPEDALANSGAKKVFILLGFNDIGLFGIDGTLERWDQFVDRIMEKCPYMEVYIQSCTPVHTDGAYPGYDNELFDAYNVALEAFCQENGYHYVNIAPYFKDFTNGMATKYSSDYFVHMSYEGTAVWERVLKAYAAEQSGGESE